MAKRRSVALRVRVQQKQSKRINRRCHRSPTSNGFYLMTTSITPEIVGSETTERLVDTDLTPTELARVESLETKLRMSDASVLEQRIIQGETLFRIQQEALYRSRQSGERFTWEQYLEKFTPALTKSGKGYKIQAAQLRQLMYLIHSGQIPSWSAHDGYLPLPTGSDQLQPLLAKAPIRNAYQGGGFDLTGDWNAVREIWKGANAKGGNPDRQSVSLARTAYETKQVRAGQDPGRMMSPGQQAALENMNAARNAVRPPEPVRDYSPEPQRSATTPAPSIPAWEIQKDDSSIDAGAECKRISLAINEAHKSIGLLRGILYSQTQAYGSDYLDFLRQVDAGVYSLHNIDDQVQQMGEDIQKIVEVLTFDAGAGELAKSTVEVSAFPTKG